jgi:hypothetical protein
MSDVPSIPVFCSDYIVCFPGMASKFSFKPFVTISVAPIVAREKCRGKKTCDVLLCKPKKGTCGRFRTLYFCDGSKLILKVKSKIVLMHLEIIILNY